MSAALRIRPDDDRLAHGVVRSAALEQAEIAEHANRRLRKSANATAFALACLQHFGQRIGMMRQGSKLTGSRAKVDVLAFEPSSAGDFFALRLYWRGDCHPHVIIKVGRIVIERHCVARYLQRTAGNADVNAAVGALMPYLGAALHIPYADGRKVRVSGPEGQLRILHEGGYLLCKTWLSDRKAPEMTTEVTDRH